MILRRLLLALATVAACVASHAQVTITYNLTPASTRGGLIQGQPVAWTFTLNPDSSAGRGFYSRAQVGDNYNWNAQGSLSETTPFLSVTGGLFGGTLNAANIGSSGVQVNYMGTISSVIYAIGGQNLGLTYNGELVTGINVGARVSTFTPTIDSVLPDLNTFMTASAANYGNAVAQYIQINTTQGGYSYYGLDVSSVTISAPAAIPEPSTYAALAGVCALGLVAWRRRQAKRVN